LNKLSDQDRRYVPGAGTIGWARTFISAELRNDVVHQILGADLGKNRRGWSELPKGGNIVADNVETAAKLSNLFLVTVRILTHSLRNSDTESPKEHLLGGEMDHGGQLAGAEDGGSFAIHKVQLREIFCIGEVLAE